MTAVPRVVVSAPSSGHGKTAITVGLLAALAARGLPAAGFKVGPDHTDAAYLGLAAGRPGRNLDPRLVGGERIGPLFAHGAAGAEVAVVEGSMGLFDSLTSRPETDSTAAIATALRAPVLLVIDVAALGQSVAAVAHGFRAYDEMLWLGGVILNRVASDRHEQLLRDALDDIGVPVFGALRRRDLPAVLPPRQHGVVPVLRRSVEAHRAVRRLGEAISNAVDLDRLMALARSAPRVPVASWSAADAAGEPVPGSAPPRRPIVALAGGPTMSYSYPEAAELLTAAGAEVVPVDPLRDEALPAGTDALVIGGALPETYVAELSANRRLCIAVAELARTGRPVLAEGTGLLWLAREFDGQPMCGVLDATGQRLERTVAGYREATARADSPVARTGARVVGYKQHRGVLTPRAGQTPAWSWGAGTTAEGFVWRRVYASQLVLHWAGIPGVARRLIGAALAAATAPPAKPAAPVAPASSAPPASSPVGPPPAEPAATAPPAKPAAPAAPTSPAPSRPAPPARPAAPTSPATATRPVPPASDRADGRPGSGGPAPVSPAASPDAVPTSPAPPTSAAPVSPGAPGTAPVSPGVPTGGGAPPPPAGGGAAPPPPIGRRPEPGPAGARRPTGGPPAGGGAPGRSGAPAPAPRRADPGAAARRPDPAPESGDRPDPGRPTGSGRPVGSGRPDDPRKPHRPAPNRPPQQQPIAHRSGQNRPGQDDPSGPDAPRPPGPSPARPNRAGADQSDPAPGSPAAGQPS